MYAATAMKALLLMCVLVVPYSDCGVVGGKLKPKPRKIPLASRPAPLNPKVHIRPEKQKKLLPRAEHRSSSLPVKSIRAEHRSAPTNLRPRPLSRLPPRLSSAPRPHPSRRQPVNPLQRLFSGLHERSQNLPTRLLKGRPSKLRRPHPRIPNFAYLPAELLPGYETFKLHEVIRKQEGTQIFDGRKPDVIHYVDSPEIQTTEKPADKESEKKKDGKKIKKIKKEKKNEISELIDERTPKKDIEIEAKNDIIEEKKDNVIEEKKDVAIVFKKHEAINGPKDFELR